MRCPSVVLGLLFGCTAAVSACSILLAGDLDGASDPITFAPPGADGAATAEAGRDVSAHEAGADSSMPVGCRGLVPTPQFCEDFDDDPLSASWDLLQRQGGTLDFDPLAYSPPRSGRVNLVSAPECSYVRFERTFSGIGRKRVEVRVQMRPTGSWDGQYTPLVVHLSQCALLLYVNGDGDAIHETGVNIQSGEPLGNDVRTLAGAPQLDEWTDVRIAAVPGDDGGAEVTFSFHHPDGTSNEKTISAPQCKLAGDLFIAVGYHCNFGSSETRYDDVRAYWE